MLNQVQRQSQKQTQKISQVQIQAVNMLAMSVDDLREEIYRNVNENPALKIVKDKKKKSNANASASNQLALEAAEDHTETLQTHLMHQLNSMNLSFDEFELSQKLIYNLDKNGFYGTMLAPESFINKTRPLQTPAMLKRCIERIQRMDPVGTCCKTPEESLYIQALVSENAPKLALFILDGHIELLNPPEIPLIYKKLVSYQKEWHSKKFAGEILLDKIHYDEESVERALDYILHLNMHPAQDYLKDTNSEYETPDIVLKVQKKAGPINENNYEIGLVSGNRDYHFQILYASGELPELSLSQDFAFDKDNFQKAKNFIEMLAFRESSLVAQGCAIVNAQKDFFLNGPGNLNALTRHQIAEELKIHESTVSRMSARKSSKYIQTEWGLFPASYFFTSGVMSKTGEGKISSEVIKQKILELISLDNTLSDLQLTQQLNSAGISIARRTVAKYRKQLGVSNSYGR